MINEMDTILKTKPSELENYFSEFRENTIGVNHRFESIYGHQNLLYADWIASGRLYFPIEDIMLRKIGPMIANTHSFSSQTGKASTYAYQYARQLIKKHVNASESDCLVATGTGMTAALNKLQRIMGLLSEDNIYSVKLNYDEERPVVFITHMEHHSNQVPWYETIADVVVLPCGQNNLVDPKILSEELKKYKNRRLKIGSFTACSNVTGIITPYHELAKIMHQNGGYCFVDFAASAPYVKIDMHPKDPEQQLDAIFFSPHKFLGGPGTCGILVFDEKLYQSNFPDNPGGGNVKCTNPWGEYHYSDAIEVKEDGGTPGFLQVMRTALCLELKDKMGVEKMKNRETELLHLCFSELQKIKGLIILGDLETERIGCVSFTIENIHYNLMVRLLNDRFGIQVRGGWSCASTYAHYLLNIDEEKSAAITNGILQKNLTEKPGWVRVSLHPTMKNEEFLFICNSVKEVVINIEEWQKDYQYNPVTNEFDHLLIKETIEEDVKEWFSLD
ncbi:aminotransferase class V-fold PLP-dependent enzyme [Flavobacterium quisquiliarum]|uniref:Aminotransferase class V-fold PLP-dependent enzyme n=1 Tax=Flavobacterium quisquiliarum TaxID=1834436 RepID=A0ABV8WC27_9FLAO|nr:aminotransferase class V-fold PLP-dependent enzyme [Flavobacterium quisquiliarum]MBW1654998.1 aminotransferase class V-fold PLP-dependent enzyme [Flavobacterium quisquiliarum]NWL00404.1 selenocysteine lyase [Flavobacterium collinsii]